MPAMIPTPWIRAYDPAQEFLGGYGQGAQVGEANARLAQAAQQHAQQMQQEQQKLEMLGQQSNQKHLEEQQRLEIEKTYRDMQLTMQKRQLDTANQLMQAHTKQAADQLVAQAQFEKTYGELKAANPTMDPRELFPKALFANPFNIGKLPPGILQAAEAYEKRQPFVPQGVQDLGGGVKVFESAPNKYTQAKDATVGTKETLDQRAADKAIEAAQHTIEADEKELAAAPNKKVADFLEKRVEQKKLFINDTLHATGRAVMYLDVEGRPSQPGGGKPKTKVLQMWKDGEQPPPAPKAPAAAPAAAGGGGSPERTATSFIPSSFTGGLSSMQPQARIPQSMASDHEETVQEPSKATAAEPQWKWDSAKAISQAWKSGRISKTQAVAYLKAQFPGQEDAWLVRLLEPEWVTPAPPPKFISKMMGAEEQKSKYE